MYLYICLHDTKVLLCQTTLKMLFISLLGPNVLLYVSSYGTNAFVSVSMYVFTAYVVCLKLQSVVRVKLPTCFLVCLMLHMCFFLNLDTVWYALVPFFVRLHKLMISYNQLVYVGILFCCVSSHGPNSMLC